jgi:hypothetical protein
MTASLVLYPDRNNIRVEISRSPDGDGRIHARLATDTDYFCLLGPAADVVAIAQAFARAVTDEAVLIATEHTEATTTAELAASYQPAGPVFDGIEVTTSRLACCGAGPDQVRDGLRQHLPGCSSATELSVAAAEHIRRQHTQQPATV